MIYTHKVFLLCACLPNWKAWGLLEVRRSKRSTNLAIAETAARSKASTANFMAIPNFTAISLTLSFILLVILSWRFLEDAEEMADQGMGIFSPRHCPNPRLWGGGAGQWDPRLVPRLFIFFFFLTDYNQIQAENFQQEKKIFKSKMQTSRSKWKKHFRKRKKINQTCHYWSRVRLILRPPSLAWEGGDRLTSPSCAEERREWVMTKEMCCMLVSALVWGGGR